MNRTKVDFIMPLSTHLPLKIMGAATLVVASFLSAQPAPPMIGSTGWEDWSGDPQNWSIADGVITGQSTADRPIEANTFLVYKHPFADFEFRGEFKLTGETANSGVQYRSKVLDADKWIVAGYQADMDYANRYTGMIYEERGRGILVRPGLRLRIGTGPTPESPVLSPLKGDATPEKTLKRVIRQGEWNEIHIIAQGNHIRHFVNGVLTAEAIDEDAQHAATSGVLALQLHRGPPMTVQFRNLRISALSAQPAPTS